MSFLERLLAVPFNFRQFYLGKRRAALSSEDFIAQISGRGGDVYAAQIIRDELDEWIYVDEFTPYPDDDLGIVYGICEEDLDEDIILKILKDLHLPFPSTNQVKSIGHINTPYKVAVLINMIRDGSDIGEGFSVIIKE